MHCFVLGAAAGGGFPQWNCGCRLCTMARAGDPVARPRSQASAAISADGARWLIIGASPDMRQQILANDALAPPPGTRDSPIVGVVLISADIDGIAGMLVLREQQRLRVFAPASILKVLAANSVFASLDPALVERVEIAAGVAADTGFGMSLTLLEMPGKIPLYEENRALKTAEPAITYAARIEAGGKSCIVAPACAAINDKVLQQISAANLLLFDGTLFTDDEMLRAGVGNKTGQRMGHISVSGPDGSLARLAHIQARKVFFHINNTNPMLLENSEERRMVEAAGFEVAYDGMRIGL
jgi:pyrroloquinoline quinone biosynthesis protein B